MKVPDDIIFLPLYLIIGQFNSTSGVYNTTIIHYYY